MESQITFIDDVLDDLENALEPEDAAHADAHLDAIRERVRQARSHLTALVVERQVRQITESGPEYRA